MSTIGAEHCLDEALQSLRQMLDLSGGRTSKFWKHLVTAENAVERAIAELQQSELEFPPGERR